MPIHNEAYSGGGTGAGEGHDANAEARRLISVARDGSSRSRQELFRAIGELFGASAETLALAERRIMLDILRRLSGDVEIQVRAALAKRLAVQADAPRDLILLLARDAGEVAHDVLVRSSVLRDPDLVELVRHHAWRHQMAIAMRHGIGEDVCRALTECGNPDVVVTLLNNHSAHISRESFQALVEDSRERPEFQAPLVRREDLPPTLAERMLAWVSVALRQEIVRNFEIDPDVLDDALADTMASVEQARPAPVDGRSAAERLIDRMYDAGELTPAFAFGALRSGRIVLFELALSRLTDLSPVTFRRLLHEPDGQGLAVICRSLDIDRAAYLALFELGRRARRESAEAAKTTRIRRLAFFDATSPEAARLALVRWRRADALREAQHIIDPLAP